MTIDFAISLVAVFVNFMILGIIACEYVSQRKG